MSETLFLLKEFGWFEQCLAQCSDLSSDSSSAINLHPHIPATILKQNAGALGEFIHQHNLSDHHRFILMGVMSRYLAPEIWKPFNRNKNQFHLSVVGDVVYPSLNTFLTLLSGTDRDKRLEVLKCFNGEDALWSLNVLSVELNERNKDFYNAPIRINHNFLELFLWDKNVLPGYSIDFPAELLETVLEWGDLRLDEKSLERILEIGTWLDKREELWANSQLGKHVKEGYRAIFYGPSGTGKTLTATLIGKKFNLPVYRIDISRLVSKYVGETAKNLKNIFDMAENKRWILFFDEGDALFGKRQDTAQSTNPNATNANQDISYLLQRIENFNGLVIVGTNLKNNMDQAFARRFNNSIHFGVPTPEMSASMWEDMFPSEIKFDFTPDFAQMQKQNRLSHAGIINVMSRLILLVKQNKLKAISSALIEKVIFDETYK